MKERKYGYDVFFSFSAEDLSIVRDVATRFKFRGLDIWYREPSKIDDVSSVDASRTHQSILALAQSRVLLFFASSSSLKHQPEFEEQWVRFRDPSDQSRRFVSVRLDDASWPDSLRNVEPVEWKEKDREVILERLVALCRPPAMKPTARGLAVPRSRPVWRQKSHDDHRSRAVKFDVARSIAAVGKSTGNISLLNLDSRASTLELRGHEATVTSLDIHEFKPYVLSSAMDRTVRLWDLLTGSCLRVSTENVDRNTAVLFAQDSIISFSRDEEIRVWDDLGVAKQRVLRHPGGVSSVRSSRGNLLSAGADGTIRIWELDTGRCLSVLEGHVGGVGCLSPNASGSMLLSGSEDQSIRLWDLQSGLCLETFVAHTGKVERIAWHPKEHVFVSGGSDRTLRLWSVETGDLLSVLDGNEQDALDIAVSDTSVLAADAGSMYGWSVERAVPATTHVGPRSVTSDVRKQIQYTNAKVLLVGDSGAGKTGLSKRLVHGEWEQSASTVGAWATQWSLPANAEGQAEREIWLWDFGGQADHRLIHQLYMDETALAVLVFDSQKPNVFESLSQWDRDLSRSNDDLLAKLLVAGRVDASPVSLRQQDIDDFLREHGFRQFIKTSARTGQGCDALRQSILQSIDWSAIPWRSSPALFKFLKEEIVRLKDEGRVLMRFNDLRDVLRVRLSSGEITFADEELRAVLRLLSGPGVILQLEFGSWILLQPELINAYSQAVIATMRSDPGELGCISERKVLDGDLVYGSFERIDRADEQIVLLEMHRKLVERGLCARELTDKDALLVFPTYYKRNRPALEGHPAVLVSYNFDGIVDEVYATLVVRLNHTNQFRREDLWQDAAEFTTQHGKRIGVKLAQRITGHPYHLEVYCELDTMQAEQIIFTKFVHDHLLQRARNVVRRRQYICKCGHPFTDFAAVEKRRDLSKDDIVCPLCEERVQLEDELEKLYASPEIERQVRRMEGFATGELQNESKERILVGEVMTMVGEADQIAREKTPSDHGIDMEIEFRWDDKTASGKPLLLQLKSGDSHLYKRADGKEIFAIKNPRHAVYWADQIAPVMLVIRSSNGDIRWMEIRDYLVEERKKGNKVTQLEFKGVQFNIANILKWRKTVLDKARE